MRQWLLCGALSALSLTIGEGPSQTAGQAPTRADAAISGVVTDAATKQPIAEAIVSLGTLAVREYPETRTRQFTDSKGRFAFADLPSGVYSISVAKPGYLDGAYGRVESRAEVLGLIVLTDGRWFANANVTMTRPGSVSGTVLDERGEPFVGVYVRLLTQVWAAGHARLAVGPITTTDDRGMYRIGKLMPGRYNVMVPSVQIATRAATSMARAGASPGPAPEPAIDIDSSTRLLVGRYATPPPSVDGQAFAYPAAFAGGVTVAQATAVEVVSGSERSGINVRLDPVPAFRVSGMVDGPLEARSNVMLRLLPAGLEDLGFGAETGTAFVAPDGTFVFAGVPAGTYLIDAPVAVNQYAFGGGAFSIFYAPQLPQPPGLTGLSTFNGPVAGSAGASFSSSRLRASGYWGRATVVVSGRHESGVVVALRPAAKLTGRIVAEIDPSYPTPPTPARYVSLEAATGDVWLGDPRSVYSRDMPTDQFAIDGVLPGRYVFRGESSGWVIKSVVFAGRDYTFTPIDVSNGQDLTDGVVTFTNAAPLLSGTVRDSSGSPAAEAAVIVFPVEREQWTD